MMMMMFWVVTFIDSITKEVVAEKKCVCLFLASRL